jgi:hypothetical protein
VTDPHGYVLFAKAFIGLVFVLGFVLGCIVGVVPWVR